MESHSEGEKININTLLENLDEMKFPSIFQAIVSKDVKLYEIVSQELPVLASFHKAKVAIKMIEDWITLFELIWRRMISIKMERGQGSMEDGLANYVDSVILPLFKYQLPALKIYIEKNAEQFKDNEANR